LKKSDSELYATYTPCNDPSKLKIFIQYLEEIR